MSDYRASPGYQLASFMPKIMLRSGQIAWITSGSHMGYLIIVEAHVAIRSSPQIMHRCLITSKNVQKMLQRERSWGLGLDWCPRGLHAHACSVIWHTLWASLGHRLAYRPVSWGLKKFFFFFSSSSWTGYFSSISWAGFRRGLLHPRCRISGGRPNTIVLLSSHAFIY